MCPYIEDKDVACLVILMENCVSYPGLVMLSDREIVYNVVDILVKTLALLKKSTDIATLFGSRIEIAQVLNIPGIGYLITIYIRDSI